MAVFWRVACLIAASESAREIGGEMERKGNSHDSTDLNYYIPFTRLLYEILYLCVNIIARELVWLNYLMNSFKCHYVRMIVRWPRQCQLYLA